MAYYVLRYTLVEDYLTARDPYRSEHLALLQETAARGELRLAGAHGDTPTSTLVWQVDDPAVIEEFVRADPFVAHGIATSWEIVPWNVAVGADLRQ